MHINISALVLAGGLATAAAGVHGNASNNPCTICLYYIIHFLFSFGNHLDLLYSLVNTNSASPGTKPPHHPASAPNLQPSRLRRSQRDHYLHNLSRNSR